MSLNVLSVPMGVAAELGVALAKNEGNLGRVFALMQQGVSSNKDLVAQEAVANSGAAGNARATVRAILEGIIPSGPSVAMLAGGSVGGLLRANPDLSDAARAYLADLRAALDEAAADPRAVADEERLTEDNSRALEVALEDSPGVYAYTLRSFFWYPAKKDPIRHWYKVGKTDRTAGMRVGELMRANGLPEEPWIERVYRHQEREPAEIESAMHNLLESAGHGRSTSRYAGREWFATNLTFLDALARTLGCEILRGMRVDSESE